jgi:hypothetical protein
VTSTPGIEPVSTHSPHAGDNMSSKLRPLAALAMSNQTNIEPASMPTVVSELTYKRCRNWDLAHIS